MNNILIINQFSSYPNNGFPTRSYSIANEFSKKYRVCLCFGSYHHRLSINFHQRSDLTYKSNFSVISLKLIKSKDSFFMRIINWFIFSLKLPFIKQKDIGFCPEIIIYSSPSLIGYIGAFILSKRLKSKIYFEVRDIWPLSIHEILGVNKLNPAYLLLQWVEDFAYKNSYGIVSSLKNLQSHINNRINKKLNFHYSPNCLDEELFNIDSEIQAGSKSFPLFKEIEKIHNLDKKIVAYVGGISTSNNLDAFIETAKACNDESLAWVCIGDGPDKKRIVNKCRDENIDNVIFFSKQEQFYMKKLLKKLDILFLANQFLDLYSYGISPIKLAEHMSSGTPIIHVTNGYSLLEDAGCWVVHKNDNPKQILNEINSLLNMDETLKKMHANISIQYINNEASIKNICENLEEFLCK